MSCAVIPQSRKICCDVRENAFWPKFSAAPCALTWIPVTVLGLALPRSES